MRKKNYLLLFFGDLNEARLGISFELNVNGVHDAVGVREGKSEDLEFS